jgi:5'-phosphate synthase pdxT subunit
MIRELGFVEGRRVLPLQVRTPEDLARCDALIIPGGGTSHAIYVCSRHSRYAAESTTIALLIRLSALHEPIHAFLAAKPVWGTCAGAILLSRSVVGAKRGGQELLGALDVDIERNGFGSQLDSFEAPLALEMDEDPRPFNGVFIRAPVRRPSFISWGRCRRACAQVVLSAKAGPNSPAIEIISRIPPSHLPEAPLHEGASDDVNPRSIVALRQGRHMLTTFHPELSGDNRFHKHFVETCVLGK